MMAGPPTFASNIGVLQRICSYRIAALQRSRFVRVGTSADGTKVRAQASERPNKGGRLRPTLYIAKQTVDHRLSNAVHITATSYRARVRLFDPEPAEARPIRSSRQGLSSLPHARN